MDTITDIAKQLGQRGGLKTKQNQPPDYYKNLGKLAMSIRWKNHVKKQKKQSVV